MRFGGRVVFCRLLIVAVSAVACGRTLSSGDVAPDASDGSTVPDGGAQLVDAPPGPLPAEAGDDVGLEAPLAFLSDTAFLPGDGGILEADRLCQQDYAAKCKGCPPGRTFVAWISDTKNDAINRVPRRQYATPHAGAKSGRAVITDGGSSFPAGLFVPIGRLSANNDGGAVWTGTDPTGKQVNGHTCEDFLVASASDGHVGRIHATTSDWTQASDPVSLCNLSHPVYCFQVSP